MMFFVSQCSKRLWPRFCLSQLELINILSGAFTYMKRTFQSPANSSKKAGSPPKFLCRQCQKETHFLLSNPCSQPNQRYVATRHFPENCLQSLDAYWADLVRLLLVFRYSKENRYCWDEGNREKNVISLFTNLSSANELPI